jgi:predicted nucleic acid-binding protein
LEALDGIVMLPITEAVVELAEALIKGRALPDNAQNDAVHIATAAVHGVDYLLTWNFRHLANAETKPIVREVCQQYGYASPEICTPSELMGGIENAG